VDQPLIAKAAKNVRVGDSLAVATGGTLGLEVIGVFFEDVVVELVLESEGGTHTFDPDELVVLLKRA
jgi:hypothetical protein